MGQWRKYRIKVQFNLLSNTFATWLLFSSIDQVSCPADYYVLTRFVSAQNAECFVLPPPTQDPIVYAQCRCERCREEPSGRPNRINKCKPVLTPAVITVFCPLSSTVRVFPMRVQIPTSCRCMLAQPQVRRGL
ncbi:hypothetical protein ElyMa_005702500 [Elysia marginata]|uniref:CTCK domain-containing protein n=1 Tax=Elysia marginata TaxID=1093978 RepID=A0AAV4FH19_9GAST|nr:hypothetical protein ElyMa_005702500 [Elysia marginata]